MPDITQQTLDMLAQLRASGLSADQINKAFTQATGLVWYDLEAPAKALYPYEELIPLIKTIPRVKGGGDTATRWKAITGINVAGTRAGVSEGNRGAVITTSVVNYSAPYKGLGLEDYATFEAGYASVNFDDPKARAVQGVLRSVMIMEEKVLISGNASLLLGTTPTPTLTASGSGSALTNQSYGVYAVALSDEGFLFGPTANQSGLVAANSSLVAIITKNNADASQDTFGGGVAQKSAQATVTPTAGQNVNATVAAVSGAFAYAWYFGPAGAETLHSITTINSQVFTAASAAGTQAIAALPASDNSTDALVFDGILTQIFGTSFGQTSNSYVKVQATGTAGTGTPLTSDNASGIVELDTALKSFWDNFRLSPSRILVNSQEALNMNKKIVAGGGAPLFRFTLDGMNTSNPGQVSVVGGSMVGSYLNKFFGGGKLLEVRIHPWCPPGTIIFWSDKIPYALSDVVNIFQMKTRQEYYQIEWPLRTRKYEFGVYVDEVAQNYFPPAYGAITNIANG